MDGSTEVVDVFGPFTAWLSGKVRARAKKTYLLNVEEIRGSHGHLVLKKPVRLYCPKCGYEKIITTWIDATSIADTSYKLAKERRELECPKCGTPLLSEPCILYPHGWEVLKEITEEIRGSPVETKGSSFYSQLLIEERVSVPGPEVRRARV